MEKKNNKWVIILLIIIIIILGGLCYLFATDKITFNQSKDEIIQENAKKDDINNEQQSDNNTAREEYLSELKKVLSDRTWINNNLLKESCFGEEINNSDSIELKFSIIDNDGNLIVIVHAYNYGEESDNWINSVYRIFYNGSDVVSELVSSMHPGHGGFSIDVNQGYIISDYIHMGENNVTIYDVKGDEIKKVYSNKINDSSERSTKLAEYNIKDSSISIKLDNDNINMYIK